MEIKQKELIELEHKYKMEEIETKRKAEIEVERLKFDNQLQLQRIRGAEIRRNIERRGDKDFTENYWRENGKK